jgi:hypothetical protein
MVLGNASLILKQTQWNLESYTLLSVQILYCGNVAYADDIANIINKKFPHTVSEVLQTVLHTVQQWC